MSVTIGADPEFFFRDRRTGTTVPVIGLIGGTKGKPLPIPFASGGGDMPEGFGMQEDNVMAEYNVPPAGRYSRFSENIVEGWQNLANFVRTKEPNLIPDVGQCSRLFTEEQLDHPQAATFGCSRDYSAYNQGAALSSPTPESLVEGDGAWRFAGGHVHLGYESEVPDFVVAQFADVFLGLPSVAVDTQGKRRELYGSAGRYRPTEWGIEYRTLSNFWIWDHELADQVGQRAIALGLLIEGDIGRVQSLNVEIPWRDVQKAINEEDEELAADLIAYCSQDLGLAL